MSYKERKLTIGFPTRIEKRNLTRFMSSLGFKPRAIENTDFYGMLGYSLKRGNTEFIAFYHPERYAKDIWNSKRSLERASGKVSSQMTLKAFCYNGTALSIQEQHSLVSAIVFNFKGIAVDHEGKMIFGEKVLEPQSSKKKSSPISSK